MKIFIDESGSFKRDDRKDCSISCIGALVIPDWSYALAVKKYEKLRKTFPQTPQGEVKGRLLNEQQIAKVIDLLRRHDAIFEAAVIDMNVQDEKALPIQKKILKENHSNRLSPKGQEKYKRTIKMLVEKLDSMSPQLFVQFVMATRLLKRILYHAPTYYSQRQPKELGNFEWYVDAKGKIGLTTAESWWRTTLAPFLSGLSKKEPSPVTDFGDYSFFDAAYGADIEDWTPLSGGKSKSTNGTDLQKIFSKFKFLSDPDPGLELADIVTNTLRRALVGNLQEAGWVSLPDLMIKRGDEESIPLIVIDDQSVTLHSASYQRVYNKIKSGRKSMFTDRNWRLIEEKIQRTKS